MSFYFVRGMNNPVFKDASVKTQKTKEYWLFQKKSKHPHFKNLCENLCVLRDLQQLSYITRENCCYALQYKHLHEGKDEFTIEEIFTNFFKKHAFDIMKELMMDDKINLITKSPFLSKTPDTLEDLKENLFCWEECLQVLVAVNIEMLQLI